MTNFLVIGWGVSILWGVENCPFPLTKPVAVNTGLALPRSLWWFFIRQQNNNRDSTQLKTIEKKLTVTDDIWTAAVIFHDSDVFCRNEVYWSLSVEHTHRNHTHTHATQIRCRDSSCDLINRCVLSTCDVGLDVSICYGEKIVNGVQAASTERVPGSRDRYTAEPIQWHIHHGYLSDISSTTEPRENPSDTCFCVGDDSVQRRRYSAVGKVTVGRVESSGSLLLNLYLNHKSRFRNAEIVRWSRPLILEKKHFSVSSEHFYCRTPIEFIDK